MVIQLTALDALAQEKSWSVNDIVFQGGTSLALAWGSPRFSEDLDFLFSDEQAEALSTFMTGRRFKQRLEEALVTRYPGGSFRIREKVKPDNRVMRYDVTWTHEKRYGKALVRLEFLKTPPEAMKAYSPVVRKLQPHADAKRSMFYVNIRPMLMVASEEALIVDKLFALAFRHSLKERDIFDLWYLTTQRDVRLTAEQLNYFIDVSLDVGPEGETRELFFQSLERRLKEVEAPERVAGLRTNLEHWLPKNVYRMLCDGDVFEEMIEATRTQALQALALKGNGGTSSNKPAASRAPRMR